MLDITPLLDHWLYPMLALVLAGVAAWVLSRTSGWLDAHASWLDADRKAKLLAIEKEALDEGVAVVMQQAEATGAKIRPTVDNPIVRFGAQVAINHAAGTLADNGASPDEVAAKILARLPANVIATDTTGVTIHTIPVQIETLQPIQG